MSSLKGKTAFISGGSRGIGLAIASQLAKQGVNVMIASSSEDHLSAAISAIKTASSVNIEGHAADLRTLAGCEAAFDAHAKKFDVCDIFVHSAGATKGGVFPTQPDEDFLDGFALKFHAGVRLSRLFWPMLKAARGKIELNRGITVICEDYVRTNCMFTDTTRPVSCGAVLLVSSRLQNKSVFNDLKLRKAEWADAGIKSVRLIGDANAPGPIAWATCAGHRYARELDEEDIGDALSFRREITELAVN